VIWRSIQ